MRSSPTPGRPAPYFFKEPKQRQFASASQFPGQAHNVDATLLDYVQKSAAGLFRAGVGITVASEAEAVEILANAFSELPEVDTVRPIQSFDEIEQNHVAPNMGNILKRGIWFPKGHETAVDW